MAFSDKTVEGKMLSILLDYEEAQPKYIPKLNTDDFAYEPYRKLFTKFRKFHEEDKLNTTTAFSQVDDETRNLVSEVYQYNTLPNQIEDTYNSLKDLSSRRMIRNMSQYAIDEIKGGTRSPSDIVTDLEHKIHDIQKGIDDTNTVRSVDDILKDYTDYLAREMDKEGLIGLTTGIGSMDDVLGGWRPGQYIVVGGRPSIGKSDAGLNFLVSAAQNGHPGIFFSLEMSATEVMHRLSGMSQGIDRMNFVEPNRLKHRDKGREAKQVIKDLSKDLPGLPLYIDDKTTEWDRIRLKISKRARQGNLDLAIIDYFGLIEYSHNPYGSKQTVLREISREVKKLAKEANIPIILLAQLNRKTTRRQDNKPHMSDFRGTGGIEQDSDLGILLHRPARYEEEVSNINEMQYLVKKNRQGRIGKFPAQYNKATGKITRHK